MKVNEFISYIKDYGDYTIQSDSGWECCESEIDCAYINHEKKVIITTQHREQHYEEDLNNFELLYSTDKEIPYWKREY